MLKSDFLKALDQVQEEKGISKQSLLTLMETALATAYRRAFNPTESIRVHVDPDTAQIAIFGRRRVVEMMWEIAYADGKADEFESNLIWRAADLLGISSRERIELGHRVAARRGIT